jgi:nitrite reductase (NO-forming)
VTKLIAVAIAAAGLAFGVMVVLSVAALGEAAKATRVADRAADAGVQAHEAAGHAAIESSASQSFAGHTADDAEGLAKAHAPYDAKLPPVPAGDVARVHMRVQDMTVEIAPGVKYTTWAFDGTGAPGPIVHVRQGQTVQMTIENGGSIPHSIDFHAARIAPNKAFADVKPGESFSFSFEATDPGVFMYHCGTKPVLAHIANGMYGAIVVSPETPLPKVDNEYVLVASEWYLSADGVKQPAGLDFDKARAMTPDWATFNGYAHQYVTHPLTAEPGETTRFYVLAAGPSLDTDFHVVGTLLDRAWVNGDLTSFQRNVQTVLVPAGGGAIFDVTIPGAGTYPFVSHAFAHVELGQVGVLRVGNPHGSMSH